MLLFEMILATCIFIFIPPKAKKVKIRIAFRVMKPDKLVRLVIPLVISKKPLIRIVTN